MKNIIYDVPKRHLYSDMVGEIEALYRDLGTPPEMQDGKPDTNTGNKANPYWRPESIGDYGGAEDEICELLNEQLDDVQSPLGLDGIRHYYTTPEWDDFVEQADEIIGEYLRENWVELVESAHNQLLGI